ncbi:MAG: PIN domain-containing protein [Bacteroidales bacterium]|jgi:predicted nucleic acid-binding protein|nr:PIN domain-containing protein [Bacteroidales bacterium]
MNETHDNFFIDTNLFVYAKLENSDEVKHAKAKIFLGDLTGNVTISVQVLNELYAVFSKNKISDPIIQETITSILDEVILETITLKTIHIAWAVKQKYQYSYYDSLIIASALDAGCTILFSEDLQHLQTIEGKLKIVNPFLQE